MPLCRFTHCSMTHDYQLAQINIARPLYPLDGMRMVDFANALAAVNAFAEASSGFIWRLQDENGPGATGYDPYGDGTLINISVWQDINSLKAFVYQTGHAAFLRRKAEWFPKPATAHMALWWVQAGHEPAVEEALGKLQMIDRLGPTPDAFTFGKNFPAPV